MFKYQYSRIRKQIPREIKQTKIVHKNTFQEFFRLIFMPEPLYMGSDMLLSARDDYDSTYIICFIAIA